MFTYTTIKISTTNDVRIRNEETLKLLTSMNDAALIEDPESTWYDEELHEYYAKTRIDARLAAHMDCIFDFVKSKFGGDCVSYHVQLSLVQKEPALPMFKDQPWALTRWTASVRRHDHKRGYEYEMEASSHLVHEHLALQDLEKRLVKMFLGRDDDDEARKLFSMWMENDYSRL